MIHINQLGYQYHKKNVVLNNLSLELQPGKIYGLLGKNGAGKSTLIKNICGMLFPTNGNCSVYERNPQKRQVDFLKEMFFVPEVHYLPNVSIGDLETLYQGYYPKFSSQQFNSYLEEFNIPNSKKTTALSLGQKKKVRIGFALAANTKVLIMDEPTNGLDIPSKIVFRNMVSDAFRANRIVLISSHQVRDLDELIHAIIIMDKGKILLHADKAKLAKQWYFRITETPLSKEQVLYQEKVSNGFASIQNNTNAMEGYLDIEVLFNAVLSNTIQLPKS